MGGAEKLLVESIPRFVEQGLTIDLLLLNGTDFPFLNELETKNCCKIHSLGKGSVYNPFLIFKIIPFLKKIDLVHVHLFPALYWVALAKLISFSKTKLLFTEHSTSNKRRDRWFYRTLDRFIYAKYDYIVTISTEVKLFVKRHLAAKSSKFRTINNGVDFENINKAIASNRGDFDCSIDDKIIIQVARFTKEKDPLTLIKSVPYLDFPVRLLLVGEGPEMPQAIDLVSSLEIEDKVSFLKSRSDVPNLLKMSDLAVLSSHHEGLSLSGIEAMASGTPLVASKVSGLTTLVYGAGVLFEQEDEIDLANQINKLLSDKNHYQQIVDSCLVRAKKYGIESMVNEHIQLYTEVCKSPN